MATRVEIEDVETTKSERSGYPSGRGPQCEGSGRDVVAACTTCGDERRVGTLHCAACGQA